MTLGYDLKQYNQASKGQNQNYPLISFSVQTKQIL